MGRKGVEDRLREELAKRDRKLEHPSLYVNVLLWGDCVGHGCPVVRGRAKLDTGAFDTYVKPEAVQKLGLRRLGSGSVKGLTGGRGKKMDRYAVNVTVPGIGTIPLMSYGAYANASQPESRVALLGRKLMAGGDGDVGMAIRYDAPKDKLSVEPSSANRRKRLR